MNSGSGVPQPVRGLYRAEELAQPGTLEWSLPSSFSYAQSPQGSLEKSQG